MPRLVERLSQKKHLVDPTCRLNPICRDDLPYERRRSVRKQNSAGLGHLDIGRAIAILFAARGRTVQLAGRDTAALQREARDIAARSGTRVTTHVIEVLDTGSLSAFVERLRDKGRYQTWLCPFIGLLGDQARAEADADHAATIMRSNFEGPALILG